MAAYGDGIKPTSAGEVLAMDVLRKACFWSWYELIEVGFADPEDLTEAEHAVLFDALYLVFKQSLSKANKNIKALRDTLWALPVLPTHQGYISLHDALAMEPDVRYLFEHHAEHADGKVFFTPRDASQRQRLEAMLNQTLQTFEPPVVHASSDVLKKPSPEVFQTTQSQPTQPKEREQATIVDVPKIDVPKKSPEALSIERLQQIMSRVRGSFRVLLGDAFVHNIQLVTTPDAPNVRVKQMQHVVIPRENLLWQEAHRHANDPILQAFLCSHVYSVINIAEHQITDEHELTYQKRLIDDVLNQLEQAQ